MKLFVFGDTHGNDDFSHLYEEASKADIILHIGDLTDFGMGMEGAVNALVDLQKHTGIPVILTHGNHETSSLRAALESAPSLTYLHQQVWARDDLVIFGFGGGGFAREEPHVEDFFRRAYADHADTGLIHVWLFHGPPFDLGVDEHPFVGATGSHTKRALIEEYSPHFVVCGHIHESWGVVHQHNNTVVVNPGPDGILLDITREET